MTTLFIYVIFFLGHLSVFFYFKNTFKRNLKPWECRTARKPKLETKNSNENTIDNKLFLLNKNLRQLEFIAEFELYLEDKTLESCSLEFLQEFNQIKLEAQLSTLKTTSMLNSEIKQAA